MTRARLDSTLNDPVLEPATLRGHRAGCGKSDVPFRGTGYYCGGSAT